MERKRLGLDKPLIDQFADWMVGLATLDLGKSMWTDRPVTEEIAHPARAVAAGRHHGDHHRGAARDPARHHGRAHARHLGRLRWCASSPSAGLSIPSFWFGMLIMLALLYALQLAAADHLHADLCRSGRQPDAADLAGARGRLSLLRGGRPHDPLLAARSAAARTTSAPRAPRACSRRLVISRHALRNALLPAITVIGLEFAFLIGGLVVTEQVFNLNGIGKLFVQSVVAQRLHPDPGHGDADRRRSTSSSIWSSICSTRCSTRASGTGDRHDDGRARAHRRRRPCPAAQRDRRFLPAAAARRRRASSSSW